MSENFGFLKKIRSQKSRDLKCNHPSCYLVLDTIAENAKWDDKPCPLGLHPGESIITYTACGISPQQFETALKYLENNLYIKIIHRGRKDKNSEFLARIKPETPPDSIRITARINGTIVKLIDSSIWDINLEATPKPSPNQTRNTTGFTPNKEEIKNKEIKEEQHIPSALPSEKVVNLDFVNEKFEQSSLKENVHEFHPSEPELNITYNILDYQTLTKCGEKETKSNKTGESKTNYKQKYEKKQEVPKIAFRDNVYLTQKEYDKLVELHKDRLNEALDELDCYKGSSGTKYVADYYVLSRGGWCGKKYLTSAIIQPKNQIEENIKLAQSIVSSFKSNNYRIDILSKGIEFVPLGGGQIAPDLISFSANGFKDQLDSILRKRKFERKQA